MQAPAMQPAYVMGQTPNRNMPTRKVHIEFCTR